MLVSRDSLLVGAFFALLCWGQQTAPTPSQEKPIPIPKYGFSLRPPRGWHTSVGEDGLPLFVNFPWSKRLPQLRLPKGGAVINLISFKRLPRRRGDETLTGWAHLDAAQAVPGTLASSALEVPASSEISEAVLLALDEATFGPDDQPQRDVGVYWIYHGERFAAHLSFVVGDPQGVAYENVLKQIVFSIRPL